MGILRMENKINSNGKIINKRTKNISKYGKPYTCIYPRMDSIKKYKTKSILDQKTYIKFPLEQEKIHFRPSSKNFIVTFKNHFVTQIITENLDNKSIIEKINSNWIRYVKSSESGGEDLNHDPQIINRERGFATFSIQFEDHQQDGNNSTQDSIIPLVIEDLSNNLLIYNVIPAFFEKSPSESFQRNFLPDECIVYLNESIVKNELFPNKNKLIFQDLNNEEKEKVKNYVKNYISGIQGLDNAKIEIIFEQYSLSFVIIIPSQFGLFEIINFINDDASNDLSPILFAEPSEFSAGATTINSEKFRQEVSDCLFSDYFIQDVDLNEKSLLIRILFKIVSYYKIEKAFENFNASKCWGIKNLDLFKVWNMTKGNNDITIAIIDDAVLFNSSISKRLDTIEVTPTHQVFNYAKLSFYDFSRNNDYNEFAASEHGNEVSSLICGFDPDNGFLGIAPKCHLWSLGVNLYNGMIANRVDAFQFVLDQAKRNPNQKYIINCSWITSGRNQALIRVIEEKAIQYDNVLVVAAAGNKGTDLEKYKFFPACGQKNSNCNRNLITVASSDINDQYFHCNFGKNIIDLCAPGKTIFVPMESRNYKTEGSGTSLSAPYVSGISALCWGVNKNLTSSILVSILKSTCFPLVYEDELPQDFSDRTGSGIVNGFNALSESLQFKYADNKFNRNNPILAIFLLKRTYFSICSLIRLSVYLLYTALFIYLPSRIYLIIQIILISLDYIHKARQKQGLIKNQLKVGKRVYGTVESVLEEGIYIQFNQIYGFIVSSLLDTMKPEDYTVGSSITAKVIDLDYKSGIVSLTPQN